MHSANGHQIRLLGVLATCGAILVGTATGCSTTQEKATHAKARADYILKKRAQRQQHRKQAKRQEQRKEKGASNE